jgi:hypothetical protein
VNFKGTIPSAKASGWETEESFDSQQRQVFFSLQNVQTGFVAHSGNKAAAA